MEPQIFNIPACNLELLEKKMAKLNKKAKKAGTGEITLTKVSETVEKNKDGSVDVFHQIAIEGETPKIEGWTFVARIDHNSDPTGESNFVYVMPGQHLPAEYYESEAGCDHCGFKRKRRDTYFLRNDSDTKSHSHSGSMRCFPIGYMLQVGRTCIQDFIGIDPAKVVGQAERIAQLMKAAKDAEEQGTLGVPYDRRCIDLETFLGFVARSIREDGWVSTKEAYDFDKRSTRDNALGNMFPVGGFDPKWHKAPMNEDIQKAKDAIAYALTLDRAKSDYNHNVVTMVNTGYIDWKAAGIAASIVRIYDKHLERQAQDNVDLSNSDFIGEVGKRIKGRVKVIGKKHNVGFYDATMVRMLSVDGGNLLVTFASGQFNPDVGSEIMISGTVKKHDTFNSVKQTIVNRVREAT